MDNNYYITYYCGIPAGQINDETMQQVLDCGFNLIQIYMGDVKKNQQLLRYCEEKGVKANVIDYRLGGLVYGEWEKRLDDPEALEKIVREVCEDYRDYPALHSYNIIDEPESAKFPLIGKIVELVKKYDPNHFCYINLLPNYADPEQWGNATYHEHLQEFIDVVKPAQISYDNYSLLTDNRPDEDITITDEETAKAYAANIHREDRKGYFDNLESARAFGLANGIPYMIIVQLTEHGMFRYLIRSEILYEAYQSLVYGCNTLSYFRYWADEERPPYWRDQNSCISGDGIVCQHYYDVQAVNAEIRPIGDCIAKTRSEAVFHVGEEADNVQFFTEYKDIKSITGGRYTVGFFEDGSFLITNKDYLNSTVCIVETDAELEMLDTNTREFVRVNNKQFHIPAGGGVYLRKC